MRQANDGAKVKRNERVNVLKLANTQRVTNMKKSEARCAVHQRTLTANPQTRRDTQSRRELLLAQSELIVASKAAKAKKHTKSAKQATEVKAKGKKKSSSDVEQERFLLNGIKSA